MFAANFNKAVLVFLFAFCQSQLVIAADEIKHYGVKETEPKVGTSLTKEIVKAGIIPLNKSYADLTAEQRSMLNAEYDHMADGDEPPFPVKGLLPIYKSIARAHERLDLANKGALNINVLVDNEGNPKSVDVITSPNEQITEAAVNAIMTQKYKPAVCSGKPCAMQLPIHAELLGSDANVNNGTAPGLFQNKAQAGVGK